MHIGKRLKKLRKLRGFSQEKMSQGIISSSHYSNIEAGRFEPSQAILPLLADRLKVPVTYLEHVRQPSMKMKGLLEEYETAIEGGDIERAKEIHRKNNTKLAFIQCINQEVLYNMLRFLELIKSARYKEANHIYINDIMLYIDEESVTNLNIPIQIKYFYVSGLFHYFNDKFLESITYYKKAASLVEMGVFQASLYFNVALALYKTYDYKEAIHFSKKAKSIYLTNHIWAKTADCYNLLALLYREEKDARNAKKCIEKGLDLSKMSEEIYTKLLHNDALIYFDEGLYQEALEFLDQCIELKKLYNHSGLANAYRTVLTIYLALEDVVNVKRRLPEAKNCCKTERDKVLLQVIEAKTHYLLQEFDKYENLIKKGVTFFEEKKDWKNLKIYAEDVSNYFHERKRYKMALHYQKTCLNAYKNYYKE